MTLQDSPRYAIELRNISKSFLRQTQRAGEYTTIKDLCLSFLGFKEKRKRAEHAVLKDITINIPRGSSVGVIGRNGSGKSTLLKLITGIYRPDTGGITVSGRLAALIELGAGFHPDFTGRENIMLAGAMYGLTRREIEERFETIVDFAELGEVIDDPVRTYSSGMFMRLGFSLAIHTNPQVLLIDEVLAVGDAAFISKCKDKIDELRASQTTLLLVSHDLAAVERWCDEVIWLSGGGVAERGEPRRVIDAYRTFLEHGEDVSRLASSAAQIAHPAAVDAVIGSDMKVEERWGGREIELQAVDLFNSDGVSSRVFHPADPITIHIGGIVHEQVKDVVFGFAIHRADGLMVFATNTEIDRQVVPNPSSESEVLVEVHRLGLLEGEYHLDIAVHRGDGYAYDYRKRVITFSVRSAEKQLGVSFPQYSWKFRGRNASH